MTHKTNEAEDPKFLRVLKCMFCDRAVQLGTDSNKVFMVGCRDCGILIPLSMVVQNSGEISVGKPTDIRQDELRKLFGK